VECTGKVSLSFVGETEWHQHWYIFALRQWVDEIYHRPPHATKNFLILLEG